MLRPLIMSAITAIVILAIPQRSMAQQSSLGLDEFRLGAAASVNDSALNGYAQIEALFTPFPSVPAYDRNLSWLFSPRPLVGAAISMQGKTNEAFAGLAWNVPLTSPFFLELSFGGLVHDQKLLEMYPDRPRLTTRFLFRESIAIGYDIDRYWRIIAFAEHGSNGNLGYANRSINHLGAMVSAKFGDPTQQRAAPDPPPIANFSWTGPYVGASGGIARANSDMTIRDPAISTDTVNATYTSLNVGGYAGYNWTLGNLVGGLETDLTAQRLGVNRTQSGTIRPEEIAVTSRWIATSRARIGIDIQEMDLFVPRWLLYTTGGVAVTRLETSYCDHATNNCYLNGDIADGWVAQSAIRAGWTVGGGFEVPVAARAHAKFEYLYANFGRISFSNGLIENDASFSEHILRAGMGFGFAAR